MTTASRELECLLADRWGIVAGMDEVGRGALAGPVAVGVALIGTHAPPVPDGLTDSKALTPRRREALIDPIRSWVLTPLPRRSTVGESFLLFGWRVGVRWRMCGMPGTCPAACCWTAPMTG